MRSFLTYKQKQDEPIYEKGSEAPHSSLPLSALLSSSTVSVRERARPMFAVNGKSDNQVHTDVETDEKQNRSLKIDACFSFLPWLSGIGSLWQNAVFMGGGGGVSVHFLITKQKGFHLPSCKLQESG